jgi:hypothetical protein
VFGELEFAQAAEPWQVARQLDASVASIYYDR